jgi:uncharacterized membrane protein YvbJ
VVKQINKRRFVGMHCTSCGCENPDGAKFCIDCGAPLKNRCPSCGYENLPRAKFCAECGSPLTPQSKVQGSKSQVEKEAEGCFLQAIEIARRQSAKSLELRVVVSLSRLWQQQGKREEARQVLEEI